jgi:hypothetical protein
MDKSNYKSNYESNLSDPQKAIYASFRVAGINNIETFETESGVRYVKGIIKNNTYLFSHKDHRQYILTCNGRTLIATFNPKELRDIINKIIENPTAEIEKSPYSIL